jgi:hypothetical protein
MKRIAPLLFAPLALACSSTSSSSSNDAGVQLPPGQKTLSFSMKASVDPGTEVFKCQYFQLPAGASFVVGGSHQYTPGSHHLLMFRTDLSAIPAGQDQMMDCYEGSASVMSHVRGVVYGGQTPTGSKTFPQGIGLEMNAGEVVMLQAHYLNASSQKLDAEVDLNIIVSDGTGITTHAGTLFFYDPFIDVPVGVRGARATMRCRIPKDVTLIGASAHFHKRGYDYSAFVDDPSGTPAQNPFYTTQDWEHPGDLPESMPIAAGSYIRFGCTYDNTNGTQEYFQGPSAQNNEMCMFIGTYYPRLDDSSDEFCLPPKSDDFGTGTVACGATLKCLQNCPPVSIVIPDGGLPAGEGTEVNSCVQSCFVASCPGVSAKLFALLACTEANCKTECADAASSACNTCATNNCASVGGACVLDSCN